LFDGPAGLAYANGFLYVADGNNSTIRQVDVKTGNVVTVAGTAGNAAFADGVGASAAFNVPVGVVYDGAGFLYVTDSGNAALRKIALSNFNVTTIAGTPGTAGDSDGKGEAGTFAVPFGLVYDSASALYLTDQTYEVSVSLPPVGGSTLRKIDPATAAVSTLAGAPPVFGSTNGAGAEATFDLQFGDLAYDGSGNLYVADTGNAVVRKVDLMTGAVSTLAGLAGQSGHTDGSSHVAQFVFPSFLAYDGAGELYVSDQLCNDASPQVCAASPTIRAVDTATGAVSTVATLPWGGTTFSNPNGLAYDGAGHLFVADDLAEAILVVDVSTGTFSTLAGSGQTGFADGTGTAATFEFPYGLAYDGKANLFVTDWDVSTVRRVVVATGAVTTFAGTHFMTGSADGVGPAALFNEPQGISYDGAGHLYVADAPLLGGTSPPGGSTLRRIDVSTAEVTTVAGSPGAQGVRLGPLAMARFNNPAGVVANGSHGLFVSDIGENVVLQVLLPP
jgi:hypothetical protein